MVTAGGGVTLAFAGEVCDSLMSDCAPSSWSARLLGEVVSHEGVAGRMETGLVMLALGGSEHGRPGVMGRFEASWGTLAVDGMDA